MSPSQKPFRGIQLNRTHPLAKGLVGCWLFNEMTGETVFDLSGHSNNGTLENGVAWCSDGLEFDGVDNYVDCGNDESFDNFDAITIEALVYVKSNTCFIASKRVQGSDDSWGLAVNSGSKVEFIIWINNILKGGAFTSAPVTLNTWNHIIGVYDGSDMKVYINGIWKQTIPSVTGNIDTTVDPVRIGWGFAATYSFDGSINFARIYNRALSAEEIAWSHREPYAMFDKPLSPALLYVATAAGVPNAASMMMMLL